MDFKMLNRRTFLKATLTGALTLMGVGSAFGRFVSTPELLPAGQLSLYNTHTRERIALAFRDEAGNYDLNSLNTLNWILRCHYTNETTEMDVNTLEFLNLVDKKLGGNNEIHIVSAYRSPTYNNKLRESGHGVAQKSLHLSGKAIDISIPGKNIASIREAAVDLRMGGVVYYPGSGFVHIDSGTFRTW
jgi:uncharacterized protein YcbK (DUF882 family)